MHWLLPLVQHDYHHGSLHHQYDQTNQVLLHQNEKVERSGKAILRTLDEAIYSAVEERKRRG